MVGVQNPMNLHITTRLCLIERFKRIERALAIWRELAMEREKFLKLYSNLPINIRKEVILVLEKEGPITWEVAYSEVENKTKLSEKILKKLAQLKII